MDLGLSPEIIRNGLIFYLMLVVSLCLRAYAQAWMANRLGDRTPAMEGRLTMNPLPHMDLLGSVVLPLICIFYLQPRMGSFRFFLAWTKPMPVNLNSFTEPRKHYLLTQFSLTGMSVLLGLVGGALGGVFYRADPNTVQIFGALIMVNASLIVLDCLPLPPLPGGTLLWHLGVMTEETYLAVARWSGLVFIVLINIPYCAGLLNLLVGLVSLPFVLLMQAIAV
jgi:Zn-dependent protease